MKVSDIMLDLATGDASQYDAFVQESVGQVRVSAAYFNAGMGIASATDSDREELVQEAAFIDSGLPSSREGAIELMYEATERELVGTCRHLYMETAKIAERADKKTSPYGAIDALGKSCGMSRSFDGSLEYITEYAKAVSGGKDTEVKEGRFLKASAAKKYTKNVINAMTLMCDAVCIDSSKITEDDVVLKAIGGAKITSKCAKKDGKDDCSLSFIMSTLDHAGKLLDNVSVSESDFTTKISPNDRATVLACDTALTKVAKFIKGKFGEDGGKCEKLIAKAVKGCSKKSVDGAAAEGNEKTAEGKNKLVSINEKLVSAVKDLIAAFNDSATTDVTAKANK